MNSKTELRRRECDSECSACKTDFKHLGCFTITFQLTSRPRGHFSRMMPEQWKEWIGRRTLLLQNSILPRWFFPTTESSKPSKLSTTHTGQLRAVQSPWRQPCRLLRNCNQNGPSRSGKCSPTPGTRHLLVSGHGTYLTGPRINTSSFFSLLFPIRLSSELSFKAKVQRSHTPSSL